MFKLTQVVPHVLSFIIPLLATIFLEVVGAFSVLSVKGIPKPEAMITAGALKRNYSPSGFHIARFPLNICWHSLI